MNLIVGNTWTWLIPFSMLVLVFCLLRAKTPWSGRSGRNVLRETANLSAIKLLDSGRENGLDVSVFNHLWVLHEPPLGASVLYVRTFDSEAISQNKNADVDILLLDNVGAKDHDALKLPLDYYTSHMIVLADFEALTSYTESFMNRLRDREVFVIVDIKEWYTFDTNEIECVINKLLSLSAWQKERFGIYLSSHDEFSIFSQDIWPIYPPKRVDIWVRAMQDPTEQAHFSTHAAEYAKMVKRSFSSMLSTSALFVHFIGTKSDFLQSSHFSAHGILIDFIECPLVFKRDGDTMPGPTSRCSAELQNSNPSEPSAISMEETRKRLGILDQKKNN